MASVDGMHNQFMPLLSVQQLIMCKQLRRAHCVSPPGPPWGTGAQDGLRCCNTHTHDKIWAHLKL